MSQTIHCTRHPQEEEGDGQTVEVSAFRVFAVRLGRFHHIDERHEAIFQGASDRLRDILTEIAEPQGRRSPSAIDLVWASVSELSDRRPNEPVVYFVDSYRDGIIQPYVSTMMRRSREHQDHFTRIHNMYQATGRPAGLTLDDDEQDERRVLSEVHIDRVMSHYPDVNNMGMGRESVEQEWANAGRGLGGMAFHELMHNVIDYHQGNRFDLHSRPGIARVDGFGSDTHGPNLRLFGSRMLRDTPAQLIPTGRRPRIPMPRRPPAQDEGARGGPDLSGLEGL